MHERNKRIYRLKNYFAWGALVAHILCLQITQGADQLIESIPIINGVSNPLGFSMEGVNPCLILRDSVVIYQMLGKLRGLNLRSPLLQESQESSLPFSFGGGGGGSVSRLCELVLKERADERSDDASNHAGNTDSYEFIHNCIVALIAGTISGLISPWVTARFFCAEVDSKTVKPSSGECPRL